MAYDPNDRAAAVWRRLADPKLLPERRLSRPKPPREQVVDDQDWLPLVLGEKSSGEDWTPSVSNRPGVIARVVARGAPTGCWPSA
jgi:hypothetical protein